MIAGQLKFAIITAPFLDQLCTYESQTRRKARVKYLYNSKRNRVMSITKLIAQIAVKLGELRHVPFDWEARETRLEGLGKAFRY